jgi:hypothetical protein
VGDVSVTIEQSGSCDPIIANQTYIVCDVAPGTGGVYNVLVVVSGQNATDDDSFTYESM